MTKITSESGYIRLIYDKRLQKRLRSLKASAAERANFLLESDECYDEWRDEVMEFIIKNKTQFFTCHCLFLVITFYHGSNEQTDCDNLYIEKLINSTCKGTFVADDGPEYITPAIHSIMEISDDSFFKRNEWADLKDKTHTELYIMPIKDIGKYI